MNNSSPLPIEHKLKVEKKITFDLKKNAPKLETIIPYPKNREGGTQKKEELAIWISKDPKAKIFYVTNKPPPSIDKLSQKGHN